MIGSIVSGSMRLRAMVVVLSLLVMTVGVVRLEDMPFDVFPEILPVSVNVQTEALGLSAEEVEQLITVPIEADLLAGTPWVDHMRSSSVPGLSSIELTFKRGTDPMNARQMVQERLTQAHALPNVSAPPQMLQPISSTNRIMIIGLSSKTQSLIEMSVLARWTIRPRLMGVPGVANVSIWGQRERQLQVLADPARLSQNDVSLIDVVKTTGNSLWYSPLTFLEASVAGTGGFVETPNQRLGVRHVLPITTAADLAKVPIEGTTIPLDRVATVVEDHQPLIGDAMNGGGPGLMLVIEKLPDVNTLEVSDHVLEALESLKPGLAGIEFDPNVYNPAGYIRTTMANVGGALLIATGVLIVLFFVLSGGWQAAVIAIVAVALSVLAALLVAVNAGATINTMVMAGLMIALGVIVDDAIAYAHGVVRRMREGTGDSPMRALLEGLAEVRGPMIFGTAIVLLAAVPALFMPGTPGALISPLVKIYALAVLVSLLVAATTTAALAMLFFQKAQDAPRESALAGWVKGMAGSISPGVANAVAALVVIAGLAGLALLPGFGIRPVPGFKEPDLLVQWNAAPGTSRPAMNRMIDRVSSELRSIPGVRNVGAHIGRAIQSDQVVGIHSSEMWVNIEPGANYEKTVSAVEEIVAGYPGVDSEVTTFLRSRFGRPLSRLNEPIVVRVYGQEQGVLVGEAQKLMQSLASINGLTDLHLESQAKEPSVEVEVDLAAAKEYGVKPGDVRRAAATLLSGLMVGNLFEQQKIFEVVVWGAPHLRHSIDDIHNLLIDAPRRGQVRLGDVAKVRIVEAPNVIKHENVARVIDIVAGVKGRGVDAVSADVRNRLHSTAFPLEYRAELMGDFAQQEAAAQRIAIAAIGIGIAVIFVLQAAFGSWVLALAVGLTLPLAAGGGILAAAANGSAMSLAALGGIMTVVGIAARQALLLVARYRSMRTREGMSFGPELVAAGVRENAGQIVTTAIITAGAVLPFAMFASKPGQEVLGPLAMVILGGLVTATLYSLCLVPALYSRFGAGAMPDPVEVEDAELAQH